LGEWTSRSSMSLSGESVYTRGEGGIVIVKWEEMAGLSGDEQRTAKKPDGRTDGTD